MKFLTVKIGCSVEHHDVSTNDVAKTETGQLKIQMFVSDNTTTEQALDHLAHKISERLKLVDLGDET